MTSLLINDVNKNISHGFASDIGTSREQQDRSTYSNTEILDLFGVFDGHGPLGADMASLASETIKSAFEKVDFTEKFFTSPDTAILELFEQAELSCCNFLADKIRKDERFEESDKLQESAFNFTSSGTWPSTYKPNPAHYGLRNVSRFHQGGTTGTILIILKKSMVISDKQFPVGYTWCGNVGDSSAYEWNEKRVRKLTHDHKPTDPGEFTRVSEIYGEGYVYFKFPAPSSGYSSVEKDIFNASGTPTQGIYCCSKSWDGEENWASIVDVPNGGRLAMSRSLGDIHLKPAVSWVPTIQSFPPTDDISQTFIVLASDGLWDAWCKKDFSHFMDSHKTETPDVIATNLIHQNVVAWKSTFSPNCGRDNTMICIIKIGE